MIGDREDVTAIGVTFRSDQPSLESGPSTLIPHPVRVKNTHSFLSPEGREEPRLDVGPEVSVSHTLPGSVTYPRLPHAYFEPAVHLD